jgi:formamidopyrimidine-DNA glycosylase
MPELPEVETIRNELSPHIIGHTVTGVTFFDERIVRQPPVEEFNARLIGQGITGLRRRGKYLLFSLTSGQTLVIHLKMTGSLWLKPPDRFVRAVISLDGDKKIYFRDPRKFGVMWLVDDAGGINDKLGPEPLEAGFTTKTLTKALAKRTAPVKALLCDQKVIAGIGNMYADEALFLAKIHPMRAGGSLSGAEIERLHRAIRQVLTSGIKEKGASTDTYFRPSGDTGTAHFKFRVAHRRGESCPVCGTPLERLPVRNRGSYFCPRCQSAEHPGAKKADRRRK